MINSFIHIRIKSLTYFFSENYFTQSKNGGNFFLKSLKKVNSMSDGNFVYLTKERLHEIELELQHMKQVGRKEIAGKIAEARAHGDLSENAEYDAAKEEQGLFELKISQMESILSRVRVIDSSQFNNDTVHILSSVTIKNLNSNKVLEYTLVSPEEADFQLGKISITSPIGHGLLNRKEGEKIKVKAPAGFIDLEILKIA